MPKTLPCIIKHMKNYVCIARNLRGESGLFFTRCNIIEWPPYCRSRMEVSYCTFGLGTICAHNRYHVIHGWITNMHAWFNPCGKGNSCLLGGLRYKKCEGTITLLHTWRQDGYCNRFPLKFPWCKVIFKTVLLRKLCVSAEERVKNSTTTWLAVPIIAT